MKRILILAILLMSSLAWAGSTTVVVGQGGAEACSGVFGNDLSTNSSYASTVPGMLWVRKVTLNCSGNPASIHLRGRHFDGEDNELKFVVYDDDGTDGAPGTRLWYGNEIDYIAASDGTVTEFEDATIDVTLVAGDYYIGCVAEGISRIYASDESTSDCFRSNSSDNYTTPAATFGANTALTDREMEIWLEF